MDYKMVKKELIRMGRVKEYMQDLEIFGAVHNGDRLYGYRVWTDESKLKAGQTVTITNSNCEFEYDNVRGCFENNLLHCFICDLQIIDVDLSGYNPDKSNNGGDYAFAECKVLKVGEIQY